MNITVSWITAVWIIAAIALTINQTVWFLRPRGNDRFGIGASMEAGLHLLIHAVILIVALVVTVILK